MPKKKNVYHYFVAGRSWEDKISDMRQAMTDKDVDMLVVTGLDETACELRFKENMGKVMRKWVLWHMRTTKVQISLRICAV